MMKAIFGQDIKVGDTIDAGRGHSGKVLKHLYDDSGGRKFELDIGHLSFLSGDVVGLLHRPDPEVETDSGEKNKQKRLQAIDTLFINWWLGRVDREVGLVAIYEAIEDYELSKPLAEPSAIETTASEYIGDRGHHIDSYEDGYGGPDKI